MSKLFELTWRDIVKALVVAVLAMALVAGYKFLLHKGLALTVEDVKTLKAVLAGSGLGYLIKNFFTDKEGKLGGHI